MLTFRTDTDESSDSGSTPLKPPCSATEDDHSVKVKQCCRVFNEMFHRSNTDSIMTLMKYSLDLSNPWVTQYYPTDKEGHDKQTLGDNRDIYKVWLGMTANEMLKLFSKNGRHYFLEANGYLNKIKCICRFKCNKHN